MRKPLTSRLIGIASLYCIVFCLLVVLQFSNMGNFSFSIKGMNIRGRYLEKQQTTEQEAQPIAGGVKIFYNGLDFSLKEERGKGLTITDLDGKNTPVNPQKMLISGSSVTFLLPEGTEISFNSIDSANGQELHINAEFNADISEISIPIIPRRSSLVRDSGQLGIMYGGMRYTFSSLGQELEKGVLTLSRGSAFISYRSRGKQRAFDPADYIIEQVNDYDGILRNWQTESFNQWNQNASSLQYEDDIIAYGSQSLSRGNYLSASRSISRDFIGSSRQSYRSAVFVGGTANAYRTFVSYENEKNSLINRLINEGSLNILKEEHILDFLFTRNNLVLANEVINIINNATPDMLISDHCPGLLEVYYDIRRWRTTDTINPIEHLTDQMLLLISQNLNHDAEKNAVYVSSQESNNSEYSMRLGKALVYWADSTQNTQWAEIGRSLILSAIANGNAGRLHNILNPTDYYPKALWLSNEGHWAWTASQSVRTSYIDGNLNLSVSFPVNMTHFMIIRGVRPFIRILIHGMDWRMDNQMENYDSSGWIYYPEEQILILKLRHRVTVENIRLIYRIPEPVITVNPEPETGAVIE